MQLYLIRHGETDFNKKARFCGITNPPLNKKGISQAKKLVRQLKHTKIELVYASPLRRANQTAQIIFKNTAHKIISAPVLREINFGRWERLTYRQVMDKYPARLKKWLLNPWTTCPPDGESLRKFQKRILDFVRESILALSDKGIKNTVRLAHRPELNRRIALVTHGGVIKIIYGRFKNHNEDNFWSFNPLPGSLVVLKLTPLDIAKMKRKVWKNG